VGAVQFNTEVLGQGAEFQVGRQMNQTGLSVAMLEAGYQTSMNPKALRDAVGVVLREGAFAGKGGKWE
jgi:hypothetical protein